MGWWDNKLQETIAAIARGMAGARMGPGVLGTIVPIVTVGFVALAVLGYGLAAQPIAAVLIVGLGLAFLVYAVERSFRYAEKNPLPAILSGTEIYQLVKDQTSAKDKAIVVDSAPIIGAPTQLVEHQIIGDDHA
jgi:hypothetical protein